MSYLIANNYRIDLAPEDAGSAEYSLYRRSYSNSEHSFSLAALYEDKALLVRDIISDEIFRQVLTRGVNSLSEICTITDDIVTECIDVFSALEGVKSKSCR